ncbi:MAG: hypothetical protein MJ094_03245 [Saccharofermentans sp.]|nr:hypothetical protein [Saccharofermentans sp.]
MADWNTHLYCAHKANESLKFTGKELDLFLYGNLLPDVNMGWIITPDIRLMQDDTHFNGMGQGYFMSPRRFYAKYKKEIDSRNPLFLGYMFHLWLDVTIMTDFVSRLKMSDLVDDYETTRRQKWYDMGIFISSKHFSLSTNNLDDIVNESKQIDEVKISKNDLIKVSEFIKDFTSDMEGHEYKIYTQDALYEFYERTCQDFINWCTKR